MNLKFLVLLIIANFSLTFQQEQIDYLIQQIQNISYKEPGSDFLIDLSNLVQFNSTNLSSSDYKRNNNEVIHFINGYLYLDLKTKGFSDLLTIIFWINFGLIDQPSVIFFAGNESENLVLSLENKVIKLKFKFKEFDKTLQTNEVINSYEWYHLSLALNKTTARIYLNGGQIGQIDVNISSNFLKHHNIIGKDLDSSYKAINAFIDEIRIYKREIEQVDITTNNLLTIIVDKTIFDYNWKMSRNSNIFEESALEFVSDKNDQNSAIYLNNTYLKLKPQIELVKNFTIVLWLKLKSLKLWPSIINFSNEDKSSYVDLGFHYKTSKLYACLKSKLNMKCLTTDFELKLNVWHHLALTVNEQFVNLFINGSNCASSKNKFTIEITNSIALIGKSFYENDQNIDAVYDEIKIMKNSSLSSPLILADYMLIMSKNTNLEDRLNRPANVSDDENHILIHHWNMSSKFDSINNMNMSDGLLIYEKDRFGNPESALLFESNSLKFPSSSYFSQNFSLLIWLNINTNTKSRTFIYFGNENSNDCVKMVAHENRIIIYVTNKNKVRSIETGLLELNKWYHIALTVKETIGYLYVNGQPVKTEYLLDVPFVMRTHNTIGQINVHEGDGRIIIDDIKIFNGSLSISKILFELRQTILNRRLDNTDYFIHKVFGFSFLILIIISIIAIFITRNILKNKKSRRETNTRTEILLENMYTNMNIKKETIDLSKLNMIDTQNIELIELVGSGAYGEVYRGKFRFKNLNQITELEVAIKKSKPNASEIDKRDMLQEAILLSSCNHKNLVKIYGMTFAEDKQFDFIVMEFLNRGDLLSHLRNSMNINNMKLADFISFSADIASACEYLEDLKLVHRDIAARNCLLTKSKSDTKLVAKLGDFGLARGMASKEYYRFSSSKMLPLKWMAPESINETTYTSRSDVWSFGILMGEILSLGEQPYNKMSLKEAEEYIINGQIQKIDKKCPKQISKLLNLCWMYEGSDRPSFKSLAFLFRIINELINNEELVKTNFPNFENIECDFRIKALIIDIKDDFNAFKNSETLPYLLHCDP